MPAGYSATPLAKKLGLRDGMTVWKSGLPASVAAEIAETADVKWVDGEPENPAAAHLFTADAAELGKRLRQLREIMAQDGFVWISWPKKASGVETDITEDLIRDIALPMGLVDIKVCAVDEIWSGLKLVIRKELRT